MGSADIGLIGLAVMGENLVLNMKNHNFKVAVYNRTTDKVDSFINGRGKSDNIIGTYSIKELVNNLKSPRKIMLMVKAGNPVDDIIEKLIPYLNKGDIIIDGGNSYFEDTIRRLEYIESKGFLYIGTGISGGEEGALNGPSIMPGGSYAAWESVKGIFTSIAAKTDNNQPCCDWVGDNGAGHFVKMVHNGIEYADMQLISEAYHIMRDVLKMPTDEMSTIFKEWNKKDLDSYLIEITGEILAYKDNDGLPLVDKILDAAGQKGTGKWSVNSALELGSPLTLIGEAVFARCLSALKYERTNAAKILKGPDIKFAGDKKDFLNSLGKALFISKIISYAQGFQLMGMAAKKYSWELDYGSIAMMWRNGCIIRSVFLERIKEAYDKEKLLKSLLLDEFFMNKVLSNQESLRKVVVTSVLNGIPVPAFTAAISYFDGYRADLLPANLIQAQRDYFGAHTYERVDSDRGLFFHTDWTGKGGKTSSTSYNV